MRAAVSQASERRVCRLLEVPRSAMVERSPRSTSAPKLDDILVTRLEELIQAHPTYGYRRLWALLRVRDGLLVNRKAVYRMLKLKGWFCHERRHTPRPRARGCSAHGRPQLEASWTATPAKR